MNSSFANQSQIYTAITDPVVDETPDEAILSSIIIITLSVTTILQNLKMNSARRLDEISPRVLNNSK